ncbi:DUF3179 domain-containing protein [Candidatus Kaiserbacteria bacterium]|nr:DUF3179 domain-containing protein [Candidatus Kaiserbacteria bacterium]
MKIALALIGISALASALWFFMYDSEERYPVEEDFSDVEMLFERFGLRTDTRIRNVALDQIFSGGPGKDGIPALSDPIFTTVSEADVDGETLGVLVIIEEVKRFYPYTILVWHEIVNDHIGDTHFAVTFCPLCGSAIVFDRNVDGDILSFGVSGLLFESNLLMYDSATESLWSQAGNEAVVGTYTGTRLSVLPMRLLTFSSLQFEYPDAQILSQDTGYVRRYGIDPYTGYGLSEDLYFPVSVSDKRFPAKEIFYVFPYKEKSIAFPEKSLIDTANFSIGDTTVTATRHTDGIAITTEDNTVLPGYYEMWFSWATHHQEDGVVWEIE